jgi:hypothetical protein
MNISQSCGLVFLLLWPIQAALAQFVEVTTETELTDWDYLFLSDRARKDPAESGASSIFNETRTRRCVFGTNLWMIESKLPDFTVTYWFTGTNIIEHTLITKQPADSEIKNITEHSRLAMTAPPVGHRFTRIYESLDGNPGRPVRVPDVMSFDLPATFSWLAFCSAPALKREGRQIFPPSPFWKESSVVYSGWSDRTEVFQDDLGLPRSINLVFTNSQSIFQYQVHQSTNINGWNVPLQFYGVQQLPTGTNNWKLHLTFKGRVTSIGPAAKPEIPEEVMEVIQK